MKEFNLRKFLLIFSAQLFWALLIIISILSQLNISKTSVKSIAEYQAKTAYEKDFLYRQWASMHGGLYAPITEITTPNPALSHIEDRDIITPEGKELTLINPAYMTRQVHELGNTLYKLKGHITSLNPINPINQPDPWEEKTLNLFERGIYEASEFVTNNGVESLRYMKALFTEESCLKCHSIQGYKVGDVRGGLSVEVPMEELNSILSEFKISIYTTHGIIYLIGVFVIVFIFLTIYKNFEIQKVYSKNLAIAKYNEEKEREFLDVTLKSIGEGVISTDMYGNIININITAQNLTGYNLTEALNKNINEVLILYNISKSNNPVDLMHEINKRNINIISDNFILSSKSDKTFLINNSASYIHSNSESIVGVVFIFRDITEEMELQKQLSQSQKLDAVGQLTNGIAHDFNNMISGILGSAELIKRNTNVESKNQKYISLIIKSCKRAAELTSKLLSFSKTENIDLKPVDIHKSILSAVFLFENTLNKNIKISLKLNSKKYIVISEESQILNIFINLGINSSHALPHGGIIEISTENIIINSDTVQKNGFNLKEGNYIKIVVSDNGLGISDEVLPHVFDPFFTTKEQGKGTGLGLSVIYGTIKKLRGFIHVESKISYGTKFTILLPVTDNNIFVNSNNKNINYLGKGLILLVDDEDILRTVGKDLLKSLGYSVLTASNGLEALNVFEQNKKELSIIILDMIMPVMSGKICSEKIRNIDPNIPILIASGYSKNEDIKDLKSMKNVDFISKPYTLSEISRVVSEYIG